MPVHWGHVMKNSEALQQLESVSGYLREVSQPGDHSLRLVVEEAAGHSASESPAVTPQQSHSGGRCFNLYWPSYVAYLVTEEPAGSSANGAYSNESYTGQILRIYSKSHFLEHLARDTGDHPATVLHYKLICANCRVDIAAYIPPEVCVLPPDAMSTKAKKKQPASRHIGGIIGPY